LGLGASPMSTTRVTPAGISSSPASKSDGTSSRRVRAGPMPPRAAQKALTPMTFTSGSSRRRAPASRGSSSSYRWCVVDMWLFCTASSPLPNGAVRHVHSRRCWKERSLREMSLGAPVEPEEERMMPPLELSAFGVRACRAAAARPWRKAALSSGSVTTGTPSSWARRAASLSPWTTAAMAALAWPAIVFARASGYSGGTGSVRAPTAEAAR